MNVNIQEVIKIAEKADDIILEIYKKDFKVDFKVDDWTDIGIKLGVYDITFLKFSTNRTNVFKYDVCNITPSKLELLRQLGYDKFIVEPEMNKYKQTIYHINVGV